MRVDLDSELRRAERYSDLSKSAFVVGAIALALLAGFTILIFSIDIIDRG